MTDDAFTTDMQRVLRVARHITTKGKCSVDSVLAAFGLVYGKDFFTHCQTIPDISMEVTPEPRKPREWWLTHCTEGLKVNETQLFSNSIHVREVISE